MRGCIVKECLRLAKWVPTVTVKMSENDNKFRLDFDVPVCDEHKASLKLADIVPPDTLKIIQSMFRSNFISPPTLADMTLGWEVDMPKSLVVTDTNGKTIGNVGVDKRRR